MSAARTASPGEGWIEIVRRPTLEAFALAFAPGVTLVTSVTSGPIVGPLALRRFFDATRAMYEQIAFIHETSAGARSCLEWKGRFQGRDVAGATILCRNRSDQIETIQLFHSPYEQVVAFSIELARRLATAAS